MIERWKIDVNKVLNNVNCDNYLIQFRVFIEKLIDGGDYTLYQLKNKGLVLARSSIIKNNPKYLYSGLRFYNEMGLSSLIRVYANDDYAKMNIFGSIISMKSSDNSTGFGAYCWSDLFYMALVIRDEEFLTRLFDVDVWQSNIIDEPFDLLASKYQYLLINDKKTESKGLYQEILQDARSDRGVFIGMKGKKYIKIPERIESIQLNHLPLVVLLDCIIWERVEEFNETLQKYLALRKQYAIKKKLQNNKSWWIDFKALGICALAYDRGLTIDVESDFIPSWVYRGEFDRSRLLF